MEYEKLPDDAPETLSLREWLASNIPVLYRTLTQQLFTGPNAKKESSPSNTLKTPNKLKSPSKSSKSRSQSPTSFFSSALSFIQKVADDVVETVTFDEEAEQQRIQQTEQQQKSDRQIVRDILEGNAWIWVNGHFADSEKVSFRHSSQDALNCSPYLEVISSSYQSFEPLFIECGVRNEFEPRDYGNILNLIDAKHSDSNSIGEADINLAVNVAQYLSDRTNLIGDLLFKIPCADGTMDYANGLYFNDATWINPNTLSSQKKSAIKFVHPKLSIQVAIVFECLHVC